MYTYTRVVESGFHGNRSLLAGREMPLISIFRGAEMDRRLSTPVTSVRALNPPFSNSRGCCMRADPVSRRATVTHRPPFREGRRVVAALNHLSSPRDQTSLLPSSPAPLSLSLSLLSTLSTIYPPPRSTLIEGGGVVDGGVVWRGVAPRMRVLFHRCVASCSRGREARGLEGVAGDGGRGKGGGGGRSRGEERGAGRGSGLCKCAHVQISRVECAKVVGR